VDASAGTVKTNAIDADDKPSRQAQMKIETKADPSAPPCAQAVAAVELRQPCAAAQPAPVLTVQAREQTTPSAAQTARPKPAKAPDVASATAARTKPTPEAYRPRLDVSQWQPGNDRSDSHDGPRISPIRRPRQTRKGLLVGTAAACLALGIWAMVRLGQNTPQPAVGANHGSGLVVRKANPAPAPAAQAAMPAPPPAQTAARRASTPPTSQPSADTHALTETTTPLTAERAVPRVEPSMSQAPTTKPAPDAAAALPAALVEHADHAEQAAARSPTTRPADAANESVQSSDGGAKVVAKADAPAASPASAPAPTTSPATRPAEPTFHTAPGGYSLGAIMRGPNGSLAIINGKPVGEGATVRGAKVIRIQPLSVELELDGQRFPLGLGRQASDQAPAAATKKSARG
jgi:hypothetical protein